MNRKDSPQSVIDTYRRRQQMAPYFMGGLALLFVIAGIVILVIWFTRSGQSGSPISFGSTDTPTVTNTVAATETAVQPTATITNTPTITVSPTATVTSTPSGPFEYVVQEGDTCWDLAVTNQVDLEVLLAINTFGNTCPIKPGDKILIPLSGSTLPTETAFPLDVRGVKIEYTVKTNETLAIIASRFNSTIEAIMDENDLTDTDLLQVGDLLIVPVNLVTPTPTRAATLTPTGAVATTAAPATATTAP